MFRAPGTTKVGKSDLQELFADRLVKRRSAQSLGGGDLSQLVKLPAGTSQLDWLLQHCIDFFHELRLLYGLLEEHCTNERCSVMTAGPKFEYKWADGVKVKKPIKCSAPKYVECLMAWVDETLADPKMFPMKPGRQYGTGAEETMGIIFKRMFRVYAHVFLHHVDAMSRLGAEPHLNTCFRHFICFVLEWKLIEAPELAPLETLIDSLVSRGEPSATAGSHEASSGEAAATLASPPLSEKASARATSRKSTRTCKSHISNSAAIRTEIGAYAREAKVALGSTSLIVWADVEVGRLLDSGSMACVYAATWRGDQVALKVLGKHPTLPTEAAAAAAAAKLAEVAEAAAKERAVAPREVRQLLEECRLMLHLVHPNVVQMLGVASDMRARHGVVMELMSGGSLHRLVEARVLPPLPSTPPAGVQGHDEEAAASYAPGRPLRWDSPLLRIACEVASGMAYLHEQRILHRDLKPANVLLSPPPHLVAKVSDFGESRQRAERDASVTMTANKGTPAFMAPEVLRQERYSTEADVFSYGALLVNMATRQVPYAQMLRTMPGMNHMKIMLKVAASEISPMTSIDELSPDWPPEVAALAERCVRDDSEARPAFADVVETLLALRLAWSQP